MTEWSTPTRRTSDLLAPRDTLVDVLYEDEATFITLPACHVEWERRINPVALWRPAQGSGARAG
jgi:hypothetical protein